MKKRKLITVAIDSPAAAGAGTQAKLIAKNELEVSNFFSFLAAMMLAYQPVRSLATLNIAIQQGLSGAKRILPIIDDIPEILEKEGSKDLILKKKNQVMIFMMMAIGANDGD